MKSSISLDCFFKGRVYDWGWFQNTDSHTRTKITQSPPPPPITEDMKGYINSKTGIWIGRLSVKSSIWIGWGYSKAVYMIGVDSKVLTCTPVLKLPEFTPTPSLKLFTFCHKLCAIIFWATGCPNYAQWMTRYHLELLYRDEAHPASCAMLKTWAMLIRRTNKPFLGPLWIKI